MRLATGWMAEGSEFESRYGQDISPFHVVQPVLRPIQPPIQRVPGNFFSWRKVAEV
jgi:hypothetical protein